MGITDAEKRLAAADITHEHLSIGAEGEHATMRRALVPSQGVEDCALNASVPFRHGGNVH
jgi:hypothetical protein